jgi:outer membrane protein, heavy metal efflux system
MKRLTLSVSVALLLSVLAPAQDLLEKTSSRYVDARNGLTADELVARAIAKNGELLATRQQVAAARGSLTQAKLGPNPSLELGGLKQVGGTDNTISIGGSLPLELFGRRSRRIDIATQSLSMSEFDSADRERQLASVVRAKFGEALSQAQNLRFTGELLDLNRTLLELTQRRVDKGLIPPLDANIVKVEVSQIDVLHTDFEGRLEVTMLELKNLAGMKPEDELRLKGDLIPAPWPLTKEEVVKKVLAERADVQSARAAVRVAEAKLKQAQTEARPDASVAVGYQRMDAGFAINGVTSSGAQRPVRGVFDDITVGLTLSLPVRNRNQGGIQAAVAQLAEARHRKDYAELIAAREVAAAFVTYETTRQGVEIYRRGVRDQARENLAVMRKVYELGRTTVLELINDQRRYIEVETGYTDALNRFYQADANVRRAAGVTTTP